MSDVCVLMEHLNNQKSQTNQYGISQPHHTNNELIHETTHHYSYKNNDNHVMDNTIMNNNVNNINMNFGTNIYPTSSYVENNHMNQNINHNNISNTHVMIPHQMNNVIIPHHNNNNHINQTINHCNQRNKQSWQRPRSHQQ